MAPKRKFPVAADDTTKVTKREVSSPLSPLRRSERLSTKPTAPAPVVKAKKAAPKKPANSVAKEKKGQKVRKEEKPEDVPVENGATKIEEETEAAEPVAEEKE